MRARYVMTGLLLVALAGCNTGPASQEEMATIQATCQGYGFKPGTDAFAACILQLDQNRISSAVEKRRAIGQALSQASADMEQQRQHQELVNAMNRRNQMSCTSTGFGNTIRTNCF